MKLSGAPVSIIIKRTNGNSFVYLPDGRLCSFRFLEKFPIFPIPSSISPLLFSILLPLVHSKPIRNHPSSKAGVRI